MTEPGETTYQPNEKPKHRGNLANAHRALSIDADWHNTLAFNEFSQQTRLLKPPPWELSSDGTFVERDWTDLDDMRAAIWLQNVGIQVEKDLAGQAAQLVAQEIKVHPVREYLESHAWDGQPRIDKWLSYYLGADDTPYVRTVGAKWLISAIARIYEPGSQADHVLVLEGDQGLGKSSAASVLGGDWYTDEVADFGSKDAAMQIAGAWIIELSELAGLSRSDVNRTKAFITRRTDRYRPPYGRRLIEAQRQCVFIGTVNKSGDYLVDETGGRRFWPVPCKAIDLPALSRDREQLWAEAADRYRQGEPWWIDDPELQILACVEQAARQPGDAWLDPIEHFLIGRTQVTVAEILEHALGLTKGQWEPRHQQRVPKILKTMGWMRRRGKAVDGHRPWIYVRPDGPTSPTSWEDER